MYTFLIISSILLWAVVLFNLLITFRLIQMVTPNVWANNAPKLKKGQKAPQFAIDKVNSGEVTLSFFTNRPILLIFISLNCSTCLQKIPEIEAAFLHADQAGVQFCLICDIDQTKARAFVREFGITSPVFAAPRDNPIWQEYKVIGTPFYCLIDDQLRIEETGILDSRLETMTKIWRINALS